MRRKKEKKEKGKKPIPLPLIFQISGSCIIWRGQERRQSLIERRKERKKGE